MNRIRAFQESRALLTAVELDLFNAVAQGATAAEAASRMQTDERATEMLMNALVALEMLQKKDGVFRNTQLAAQYFNRRFCGQRALSHDAHCVPLGQMVNANGMCSHRHMPAARERCTGAISIGQRRSLPQWTET